MCVFTPAFSLATNSAALAQGDGESTADNDVIEEIVVRGDIVGDLGLNAVSESASRLGLSLLETPASVDIISSDVMQARGYQTVTEAVGNLAGVVVGSHPSAPSEFSMRGFDRAQITVLRDGLWIGPSSMVTRQ